MDQIETPAERIADGIIHAVGVTAGCIAVTAMMLAAVPSLPLATTVSLAVYGIGMLAMLGCSAAYNMLPAGASTGLLRRLDQAAIFLKIAGTYTPFALIKMGDVAGYALLSTVWTIALLGAAGKLLLRSAWDRLAITLYLALGWAGLFALRPVMASASPAVLAYLVSGGVLYSVGVIFHVWRSLPFQNAIWHGFVLGGTAMHFCAVTRAIFGS